VLRAAEGLVLAALLAGDVGGALIADSPASVATVYAQIENDHTITASAGTLILHGDIAGTGGQLLADGDTLHVEGAVSGQISAAIADGDVLQLDSTATLQTVQFGKGAVRGTLAIGDLASTLAGHISTRTPDHGMVRASRRRACDIQSALSTRRASGRRRWIGR
jgi:hypothetical protein